MVAVQRKVGMEPWAVDSGQWTVDSGQLTGVVDSGQLTVGIGKRTVDSGQWTMESGQRTVDSGQWKVGSGRWAVDSGQWTVGSGQWAVDGVGCWGGALWRSGYLTSFSPCLTGPVDYLLASRHKGLRFKSPGGYLCETGILLLALSRYRSEL
jgi:hypothetical protein